MIHSRTDYRISQSRLLPKSRIFNKITVKHKILLLLPRRLRRYLTSRVYRTTFACLLGVYRRIFSIFTCNKEALYYFQYKFSCEVKPYVQATGKAGNEKVLTAAVARLVVPSNLPSSEEQKSLYTQMYYERNYTNLCEDLHLYMFLLYVLLSKDGNFHILPRNVHTEQ